MSRKPRAEDGGGEPFAVLLRRLREGAGLTQEELAERAGLTAHGISALERGTRTRPYPHTVRSLALALGLADDGRQALAAAVGRRPAGGRTRDVGRGVGRTAAEPVDRPHRAGSVGPPVRGVPAAVTPLVGRDDDVAAVTSLLRRTTARLVTLTGTGGVGKTRLAFAVAEAAAVDHPDGAVFVPLAGVDNPVLVLPTVGRALGAQVPETGDADDRVLAAMRPARMLLVLDNLEHLPGAAPLLARVLAECPAVSVLATSRAALRVRGESEYAVQPLALPPPAVHGPGDVASSPAATLLLQRARAVSPGFATAPGDHLAVAALCERLAGIPLALELAAARARVLDAPTLLARLDDAMGRPGAADLPPRQQTMGATLAWSYRLLPPDGRTLLRRLAVFAGGCTLDAVEAVGGDLADSLHSLEGLVEHSLVVVRASPDGPRYGLLEPVLQHARALLGDGEAVAARTAHAEHYLAFAERAAPHYQGADQVRWLHRAGREDANLAAALEWWLELGDGDRAGRMVWSLWLYWWLRGELLRGRRLAEACLGLPLAAPVRVRATLTAGVMAFAQQDLAASGPLWMRAGQLADAGADGEAQVYAAAGQGLVALASGRVDEAEEHLRAARMLARSRGTDGEWVTSLVDVWLGTARLLAGDPDGAVVATERGLAQARRRGDRLTTYVALYGLVQAALTRGEPDVARTHLLEGIRLSVETGDEANLAYFLESLAVVDGGAGRHERALTLLGASTALRERVGSAVYGYYLPDPGLRARTEADARRALGEHAARDAAARGSGLAADEAVALALEDDAGA